ncbi:glycosyltransferase [Kineococcus indalonis]|uniref:glycosyltransferase n=1 Tax=Kineococcus indalonis TaxID=2696566 RepID=UPI00141349D6|nr:glycosyltransferase [Kineococcus indalonis]NAZ85191.1 glycosyltransferase [Kineococcus indalonis]
MRVAAVVPVRGHQRLLDGCLDALRAQEHPLDDLVVVDDSPEGSLEGLEGVRVLRSGGLGPYAARNVGWRAVDADVVLFLDARSRPRPRWSQRLLEPFADASVALAGSEVRVSGGGSAGARASEVQQFFQLRNTVARSFFLPYLPTCNLAVRRTDLEAVAGFSTVRSGGDADFCWRVLGRPERQLRVVEDVLMDWVPRDRARDYLEQNYRYGRSNFSLRTDWADRGCPPARPVARGRLLRSAAAVAARYGAARVRGDLDGQVTYLTHASGLCFDVGYRVAVDRRRLARRGALPVPRGGAPAAVEVR